MYACPMMKRIEWKISLKPVDYEEALQKMEQRVEDIASNQAKELIWLLEHPPLYTLGTSGTEDDIITKTTLPIYKTGRGGKATYHGPGQRIVYIMLNLKKRFHQTGNINVRGFVHQLESWIIDTLAEFNIWAQCREGRVGLWIENKRPYIHDKSKASRGTERKIAAIGLRIRKGVSYHGAAINVYPDLTAFDSIIPCGLREFNATSLKYLDKTFQTYYSLDQALQKTFERNFKVIS